MGGLSIWHWLIVGIIILLLFGKGRFSDMMGDVAKGLKSFKKGMSEDDEAPRTPTAAAPPPRLRDETTLEVPADRSRDLDGAPPRREP
ncbi:twin-arginine translocase TatA/TatE family subunit [Sphingosinicella sp. BN140058]|uniref:twin-arginine translocase TatA/TatE family subunit n=1 Tax=Sphingosinicella sp. BN140058 TaxID=1892855 RepID=UPI001011D690|nr:twin-arginine translocase TatA/TatE family subunit [Sphingosinicella sp. BN140058]QAY77362.1 twin-arginine translocase TatA/TatE family subunit [Sphingosinicella sp. BN140058]